MFHEHILFRLKGPINSAPENLNFLRNQRIARLDKTTKLQSQTCGNLSPVRGNNSDTVRGIIDRTNDIESMEADEGHYVSPNDDSVEDSQDEDLKFALEASRKDASVVNSMNDSQDEDLKLAIEASRKDITHTKCIEDNMDSDLKLVLEASRKNSNRTESMEDSQDEDLKLAIEASHKDRSINVRNDDVEADCMEDSQDQDLKLALEASRKDASAFEKSKCEDENLNVALGASRKIKKVCVQGKGLRILDMEKNERDNLKTSVQSCGDAVIHGSAQNEESNSNTSKDSQDEDLKKALEESHRDFIKMQNEIGKDNVRDNDNSRSENAHFISDRDNGIHDESLKGYGSETHRLLSRNEVVDNTGSVNSDSQDEELQLALKLSLEQGVRNGTEICNSSDHGKPLETIEILDSQELESRETSVGNGLPNNEESRTGHREDHGRMTSEDVITIDSQDWNEDNNDAVENRNNDGVMKDNDGHVESGTCGSGRVGNGNFIHIGKEVESGVGKGRQCEIGYNGLKDIQTFEFADIENGSAFLHKSRDCSSQKEAHGNATESFDREKSHSSHSRVESNSNSFPLDRNYPEHKLVSENTESSSKVDMHCQYSSQKGLESDKSSGQRETEYSSPKGICDNGGGLLSVDGECDACSAVENRAEDGFVKVLVPDSQSDGDYCSEADGNINVPLQELTDRNKEAINTKCQKIVPESVQSCEVSASCENPVKSINMIVERRHDKEEEDGSSESESDIDCIPPSPEGKENISYSRKRRSTDKDNSVENECQQMFLDVEKKRKCDTSIGLPTDLPSIRGDSQSIGSDNDDCINEISTGTSLNFNKERVSHNEGHKNQRNSTDTDGGFISKSEETPFKQDLDDNSSLPIEKVECERESTCLKYFSESSSDGNYDKSAVHNGDDDLLPSYGNHDNPAVHDEDDDLPSLDGSQALSQLVKLDQELLPLHDSEDLPSVDWIKTEKDEFGSAFESALSKSRLHISEYKGSPCVGVALDRNRNKTRDVNIEPIIPLAVESQSLESLEFVRDLSLPPGVPPVIKIHVQIEHVDKRVGDDAVREQVLENYGLSGDKVKVGGSQESVDDAEMARLLQEKYDREFEEEKEKTKKMLTPRETRSARNKSASQEFPKYKTGDETEYSVMSVVDTADDEVIARQVQEELESEEIRRKNIVQDEDVARALQENIDKKCKMKKEVKLQEDEAVAKELDRKLNKDTDSIDVDAVVALTVEEEEEERARQREITLQKDEEFAKRLLEEDTGTSPADKGSIISLL